MNKKLLGGIFASVMFLCLYFSSGILVFAREKPDVPRHGVEKLTVSVRSLANDSLHEPVIDKSDTVPSDQTITFSGYDKNTVIEFLKDDTCTETTLEEYLIMVVMSEMPYTFESEALRAQAVAARTYTLKMLEDASRHPGNTVCSDPGHCSAALDKKAYTEKYGADEYQKAYAAVSEAVRSTDGTVITYDGELCTAVYHSGSSGITENSYNLWGTYTPYLISVETPEKIEAQTVRVSTESFMKKVFPGGSLNTDIKIVRNDTGRCEKMTAGESEVKAGTLRQILGLKSSAFDISRDGDDIIFTVYGYGHGIGMSQNGANEMAKSGASYTDILTHYYTGVDIEILV